MPEDFDDFDLDDDSEIEEIIEDAEEEIKSSEHFGIWKIGSELGKGGFGIVYLANYDQEIHEKISIPKARSEKKTEEGEVDAEVILNRASEKLKIPDKTYKVVKQIIDTYNDHIKSDEDVISNRAKDIAAEERVELKKKFGIAVKRKEDEVDLSSIDVAIKTVDPSMDGTIHDTDEIDNKKKRVEREYDTCSNLMRKSDHIVKVFDHGSYDGIEYIVMELLPGEVKSGKMPEKKALDYSLQVCNGLIEAHRKSKYHRDLKPENFRLRDDGTLVITDWGLVKDKGGETLSLVEKVKGTVPYMSPEQAAGGEFKESSSDDTASIESEFEVGALSDIYTLGVVMYEWATGKLPGYRRDTSDEDSYYQAPDEVKLSRISDPDADVIRFIRQLNPKVSKEYEAVAMKALSKKKEERYASIDEFHKDLEALVSGNKPKAKPLGITNKRWWKQKWRDCKKYIAAGVGAAVLGAAALGVYTGIQAEEQRKQDAQKYEEQLSDKTLQEAYDGPNKLYQQVVALEDAADAAVNKSNADILAKLEQYPGDIDPKLKDFFSGTASAESLKERYVTLEEALAVAKNALELAKKSADEYQMDRFDELFDVIDEKHEDLEWKIADSVRDYMCALDLTKKDQAKEFDSLKKKLAHYIVESKVEWWIREGKFDEFKDVLPTQVDENGKFMSLDEFPDDAFIGAIFLHAYRITGENKFLEEFRSLEDIAMRFDTTNLNTLTCKQYMFFEGAFIPEIDLYDHEEKIAEIFKGRIKESPISYPDTWIKAPRLLSMRLVESNYILIRDYLQTADKETLDLIKGQFDTAKRLGIRDNGSTIFCLEVDKNGKLKTVLTGGTDNYNKRRESDSGYSFTPANMIAADYLRWLSAIGIEGSEELRKKVIGFVGQQYKDDQVLRIHRKEREPETLSTLKYIRARDDMGRLQFLLRNYLNLTKDNDVFVDSSTIKSYTYAKKGYSGINASWLLLHILNEDDLLDYPKRFSGEKDDRLSLIYGTSSRKVNTVYDKSFSVYELDSGTIIDIYGEAQINKRFDKSKRYNDSLGENSIYFLFKKGSDEFALGIDQANRVTDQKNRNTLFNFDMDVEQIPERKIKRITLYGLKGIEGIQAMTLRQDNSILLNYQSQDPRYIFKNKNFTEPINYSIRKR